MFVKKSKRSNGKIYISIVQGYRDENNNVKHKTIKSYGYLDDLKQKHGDFDVYINNELKKLNSNKNRAFTIKINRIAHYKGAEEEKNIGYIIIKKIYYTLGIPTYLKDKQRSLHLKYDLNKLTFYLIIKYIIYPFDNILNSQNNFAENFNFKTSEIKNALNIIKRYNKDIQEIIWKGSQKMIKRDTSICTISKIKEQEIYIIEDKNEIPIYYEKEAKANQTQYETVIKKIYNIGDIYKKESHSNINKISIIKYISTVILKIIENKLEKRYELAEIITALEKTIIIKLEKDIYFQKEPCEIIKKLYKSFDIKYIRYQELANIKKILKINI